MGDGERRERVGSDERTRVKQGPKRHLLQYTLNLLVTFQKTNLHFRNDPKSSGLNPIFF